MLINITQFILMKKGMRKNYAINYLAKNGFAVNHDNLRILLDTNKNNIFPHADFFSASKFLPDMNQKHVVSQIVERVYLMLDDLEKKIDVVIPKELKTNDRDQKC